MSLGLRDDADTSEGSVYSELADAPEQTAPLAEMADAPEQTAPPAAQNDLGHAVVALMAQVRQLTDRLDARETPTPHAPTPSAPITSRRPRAALSKGTEFDGDTSKWASWLLGMQQKLRVDGAAIGSADSQVAFIYSRLAGTARTNVTAWVRARQGRTTPEEFLTHLETLYGDENEQARAANRLHNLRQRENQSFRRFLPLLEREFADAGASEWDDNAKKPILIRAINTSLREVLKNRGVPSTYVDLMKELHNISTDLDTLSIATGRTGQRYNQPRHVAKEEEIWDPMDVDPPSYNAQARASARVATLRRGPPNPEGYPSKRREDRPLLGKRARWVSQEVMDERRARGACFRCGRDECRVDRCPLKMAKRPGAPTTAPAPRRPRAAAAKASSACSAAAPKPVSREVDFVSESEEEEVFESGSDSENE